MQRWLCSIYNGTRSLESYMSDQVLVRYPCLCFLKLFIFLIFGFPAKVTCAHLAYRKQLRKYQNSTLCVKLYLNLIENPKDVMQGKLF